MKDWKCQRVFSMGSHSRKLDTTKSITSKNSIEAGGMVTETTKKGDMGRKKASVHGNLNNQLLLTVCVIRNSQEKKPHSVDRKEVCTANIHAFFIEPIKNYSRY